MSSESGGSMPGKARAGFPRSATVALAAIASVLAAVALAVSAFQTLPADAGIRVDGAQAFLWPSGDYVTVTATITNATDASVKLVGVTSPDAASADVYATSMCETAAAATEGELCGKEPMVFWRIDPDQSVTLRAGDGAIILGELRRPLSSGQVVEVALEFEGAPPVAFSVVIG
jgi:copper(I)-binding protein